MKSNVSAIHSSIQIHLVQNIMRQPIILVFANSAYEEVLQNWLVAMNRLKITNYLVIALDKPLMKKLKQQGVSVEFQRCGSNRAELWALRIRIIRNFVKRGRDVIHSDADAVWIKDPLPGLASRPEDLVFSQGTDWPENVYEKWGFVLCCGLFMVRANRATRRFMSSWLKRVVKDGDDQRSCNRMLMESELEWNLPAQSYLLESHRKTLRCFHEAVIGTNRELTTSMLPHAWVQRVDDHVSAPAVMHPLSAKDATDIRDTLKEKGCWFL